MKGALKAALAVALPGGLLIGGGGLLWEKLATGNSDFDALRWPVIYGVVSSGRWGLQAFQAMRALMLIAQNENSIGQVGDVGAATGPSIGPWQMSLGDAESIGVWTPPDGASALDANDQAAYGAVAVNLFFGRGSARDAAIDLAGKYAAAGNWPDTIVAWNGTGPDAQQYGQNVAAAASSLSWGGFS